MNWLYETLLQPSGIQAVIVILAVSALGLQLGKIKLFNISLGITFVFFVGIFIGHLRVPVDVQLLHFAQNFGLIIFVYALGLQVGPGFFSSFKKGGLRLNMLAILVILAGTVLALIFHYTTNISLTNILGILSGAVTNTPSLGALQDTIRELDPTDTKTITDMALACAITYPLGVVGVILAVVIIQRISFSKAILSDKRQNKKDSSTYIGEFQVTNPAIIGKPIKEVMQLSSKRFVISRVWKNGKVIIPASDTLLEAKDHLLIISIKSDVENIKVLFGEQTNVDWNKEDIDWNHIDNSHLVSRRILVSHSKINGMKLGALKLRNLYGINITRVNRAGIDLLPSPELALQIGDRITVVGEAASIENVSKILGDEVKRLKDPNLISIFLGVILGLIVGSIPIHIFDLSVPVKLGIAGGPIVMGILMGAFGPRFRITTYTTQSANLMLRQFGIVVYLACLGISSGEHFFETLLNGDGLQWVGIGFVLTIVPVLLVAFIAMKMMHLTYADTVGMLCGGMANPMALNYATTTIEGDETAVAYATVYPASMFVRIIVMQIILMVLI